jgi:DNA replication initiation complex subunit (GINS family)
MPGHFAMGVYYTPNRMKLIVVGIYGPSANDDTESLHFYQELRAVIAELQNTFQTSNLLMAGDFNAVLSPEDSSSEHITKKRTTALLEEFIEEQHLTDLAARVNKKQHTWFRRNNNQISSRLDLILTNLPITHPKYSISMTIFDHAWVQASFGQKREATATTMKDYILGSEEFLITFYELLENRLATCDPLPIPTISEETQPEEELAQSPERSGSSTPHNNSSPSSTGPMAAEDEDNQEEEDREDSRKPMDHGLTAHNHKGRTDLHFVNDLIADVMKLHSTIERSHRARKE